MASRTPSDRFNNLYPHGFVRVAACAPVVAPADPDANAKAIAQAELNRLCAMIKESCQAHTGITEGTFFRDQGWYFYQLGRHIERADQTTIATSASFSCAAI